MLADRTKREDRFLDWKVRLFSVAAVAALVGMALEERWMIAVAIGLLLAAMLLRFLPGGKEEDDDEGSDAVGTPAEDT